MKLVTFYTETHKTMLKDFLLPSIKDNFEILEGVGVQKSQDGSYFSKGFNQSTKDKIIFLYNTLLESEEGEIILFSDVDIIFLKSTKEYLNSYINYDMVFQKGYGGLNTGFFLLKNKEEVRNLLMDVISNCHFYHDDQIALNDIIQKYTTIKYTNFDDRILSPAAIIGLKVWDGEELKIPEDTLVFHACWCAGVDNKIKLLNYVRDYGKIKA